MPRPSSASTAANGRRPTSSRLTRSSTRKVLDEIKSDERRQVVFPSPAEQIAAHRAFKSITEEWARASAHNRDLLSSPRPSLRRWSSRRSAHARARQRPRTKAMSYLSDISLRRGIGLLIVVLARARRRHLADGQGHHRSTARRRTSRRLRATGRISSPTTSPTCSRSPPANSRRPPAWRSSRAREIRARSFAM